MTESPDPNRIIIDVRESPELSQTGHIPGAQHIPIQSSPDFAFLPAPEFESRFGFPKPTKDQEVIFYCKAGVRSRAAAKLAIQAGDFGGRVGEFPGSWIEWEGKGGKADRPG
ncbi:hypothetical protein EPUS_01534 [Endocarpon pusillum Z07020]|uniref:Sulfurtransferase n=1 Tax=Endocarpon pusillum (strain Z07020 / HMAS-L-300199) TaxID=1263415 RepID=U1I1D3_ENDPU|nr:uncharacterized protein EPUS_01534 [Endocarpon pusillum Z07020]ERF75704.1 hypothetical protein EPUS_01534 [Endocarpon pusillum Z07020]